MHERDPNAEHNRTHRPAKLQRYQIPIAVPSIEHQIQCEDTGCQEIVLRHLRVGTEQRQPNRKREQRVSLQPPIAQRPHEGEQPEWQHGRHEQFTIVTGTHVGTDHTRQLVYDPTYHRGSPSGAQSTQQEVHEQTDENVVNHEPEVHRDVGRQKQTQERGGIEQVPVHRPNEREPGIQFGVPEREMPQRFPLRCGPLAER